MPCYNEEETVGYSIPQLLDAFEGAGHRLELIAVDNGSADSTGEIINEIAAENPSVVCHRVERNRGYGHGVLSGLPLASAPWIGIIPADGQVDAADVVRLYEAVASTNGRVVGKVRRRFRMDGLRRKAVSTIYNAFMLALWPGLGTLDVNGLPKILPRDAVEAMRLESRGWLLDPEIMVKANVLGLRVLELNVFARMRSGGTSNVRAETCWEFLSTLTARRLTGTWTRQVAAGRRLSGRPVGDQLAPGTPTTVR